MSEITGCWVMGRAMPSDAPFKDYSQDGIYVSISGLSGIDYEITKIREDVETFSTREEALLNGYFVMASRIPVIGAVFSTAIALYSSILSIRHICNSMSEVIVYEKNVVWLLQPQKDQFLASPLQKDTSIYRRESISEAFSTLAKFHALNMCTLGLATFAVASYSYCKKDD